MPRLKVIPGAPMSPGWVGKSWALEQGLREVKTEWVLCLDADTRPYAGLAAAVLQAALEDHAHAVSVAPRFIVETAGERWLHPALLTTLIYRLGPGDVRATRNRRRMVNGQCFLFRTSALRRAGGFAHAKAAFADDFALAAHLSRSGLTVSFRNGAKLLEVKMYRSLRETWREWGRTLGLNEATTTLQQIADIATLTLSQAAPMPMLAVLLLLGGSTVGYGALLGLNVVLLLVRFALLGATAFSYRPAKDVYWLSPFADIPAVLRIALSACMPRQSWRGRHYLTRT